MEEVRDSKLIFEVSRSRRGYRLCAKCGKDEVRYPLSGQAALIRIITRAVKNWSLQKIERFPRKFEKLIEK